MNGDGNYFPENVVPSLFGARVVRWCSGCSAEQATQVIEVEINDQWVPLDVGPQCLTTLREEGRMEL